MSWTVETLNAAVDAELEALPESLLARLVRIVELVEMMGLENLREPHVSHLEGKLWEIRAKTKDGIARAIYITATGRRVVILHVFVKKTRKTPARALEIARHRMKEVQI